MAVRLRKGLIEKNRAAAERTGQRDIDARVESFERVISGVDFTGLALSLLHENVFKAALEAIDKQFDGQPLIAARLLDTVITTMRDLGLYDGAVGTQERALRIRRDILGDDHPDTLDSMSNMGVLLQAMGDYANAEPYCREALEGSRRALGNDHPDTLASIGNMGTLLESMGKYAKAAQWRAKLANSEPPTDTSATGAKDE